MAGAGLDLGAVGQGIMGAGEQMTAQNQQQDAQRQANINAFAQEAFKQYAPADAMKVIQAFSFVHDHPAIQAHIQNAQTAEAQPFAQQVISGMPGIPLLQQQNQRDRQAFQTNPLAYAGGPDLTGIQPTQETDMNAKLLAALQGIHDRITAMRQDNQDTNDTRRDLGNTANTTRSQGNMVRAGINPFAGTPSVDLGNPAAGQQGQTPGVDLAGMLAASLRRDTTPSTNPRTSFISTAPQVSPDSAPAITPALQERTNYDNGRLAQGEGGLAEKYAALAQRAQQGHMNRQMYRDLAGDRNATQTDIANIISNDRNLSEQDKMTTFHDMMDYRAQVLANTERHEKVMEGYAGESEQLKKIEAMKSTAGKLSAVDSKKLAMFDKETASNKREALAYQTQFGGLQSGQSDRIKTLAADNARLDSRRIQIYENYQPSGTGAATPQPLPTVPLPSGPPPSGPLAPSQPIRRGPGSLPPVVNPILRSAPRTVSQARQAAEATARHLSKPPIPPKKAAPPRYGRY
jgi:hypothetical protein